MKRLLTRLFMIHSSSSANQLHHNIGQTNTRMLTDQKELGEKYRTLLPLRNRFHKYSVALLQKLLPFLNLLHPD